MINGVNTCTYTFTNIDSNDTSGNIYYYKIGIAAIYNNGFGDAISKYVTPSNINNSDKLFSLTSSVDNQNQQYKSFQQFQQSQIGTNAVSANTYSDTISTADGQYELIKAQLGNYPENLLIDEQTINKNTLSELVDKSMSQALLNINVLTSNTPSTPSTPSITNSN